MKTPCKASLFLVINAILVLGLFGSVLVYTRFLADHLWGPVMRVCGIEFLMMHLIYCPVFLAVAIGLVILGRSFPISRLNKWLPFLALGNFFLAVPTMASGLVGVALCTLIIAATAVVVVSQLRQLRNNSA